MKLKIFRAFFVAVALIGTVFGLSSCKDTDQDLYIQLKDENATLAQKLDSDVSLLQSQLSTLQQAYADLQTQLATSKQNCEAAIEQLRQDMLNNYVTKDEYNAHLAEFNNLKAQYTTLAQTVTTLGNTVAGIQSVLGQDAAGAYNTVGERFTAIESAINNLQSTLNTVTTDLAALQTQVSGLADNIATINTSLTTIQSDINNLTTLVTTVQTTANDALALAQANKGRLDAIDVLIQGLQDKDQELAAAILANEQNIDQLRTDLDQAIADAQANLDAAKTELTGMINALGDRVTTLETTVSDIQGDVADLNSRLTDLEARVAANETAIQEINQKLDNIAGTVQALVDRVSSVVLQEVSNPIIGSVSLPLDMQSMILFNYWGQADNPIKFPSFAPFFGTNFGGDAELADISFFDGEYVTISSGSNFFNENDGNMGKVYFTVNPTNINMNGKEFTLVNSLDEEVPVALKNVRPSTKLLSFGISRTSTSSNGFYEADATLEDVNDIPAIQFQLESGLKSALKDAAKDRTLSSVEKVAGLVFKQLKNGLPAYGMKVSWDENGTAQSVHSNYGIAATTFRPLSYAFLDGSDFSDRLPHFPSLQGLVDRLHFDFDVPTISFNYSPITFTSPTVNFTFSLNTDFSIALNEIVANVTVNVPEQTVDVKDEYGVVIGTAIIPEQPVTGSAIVDLDSMTTDLNDQLKTKFDEIFAELKNSINSDMQGVIDDIIADINGTVNDELQRIFDDISVEVNDKIEDVVNKLQDTVNGKVESIANRIEGYYNKIEAAYNRVKRFLTNPNHYLQATMFYAVNGQINRLSSSKVLPTVLTGTGTAITLIPTTYTFDILSPAFKKYVAVSNVYGPAGKDCSNDATCRAIRDAANAGLYMNTVIPGERLTVAFDFSAAANAADHYTYEIYYQALDYHGYTSTQKFYVKK